MNLSNVMVMSIPLIFLIMLGFNPIYAQVIFPGIDDEQESSASEEITDDEITDELADEEADETETSAPALPAGQSYYNPATNTLTADSDIANVVVLTPDSQLLGGESYIPQDITIAEGTNIIWINGQKNTVQQIAVQDSSGQEVYTNGSIPFKNGASYEFAEEGTYSYFNPSNPSIRGTVNVVPTTELADNPTGNSTMGTIGLFVVPGDEADYWQDHLNSMAFVSINEMTSTSTGGPTMFEYLQKSTKVSTVIYKVGVKLTLLDSHIYPSTTTDATP